jgi:hypothetical protein
MKKLVPFAAVLGAASTIAAAPPALRQATFDVRQEFTITPAAGAKKLRAWLTMPQKDPNQTVKQLKIESPVPYRIEKDSEGTSWSTSTSPTPRKR